MYYENSTLNDKASGFTVALDEIVKIFENAAKPYEIPNTATTNATIVMTFVWLSHSSFLQSFLPIVYKVNNFWEVTSFDKK